ncbi:rRNA N6-adenosine-methyltransferase ZCCHC4 [Prorops nasuta]|uniref:rRNA N6-adenosine-methyltransferase ZCCHC4 n=1 Tax=Prorops nasuta TaxID=863751 RepID=UPI0034D0042B
MDSASGLQCFWGELKNNPHCPHGPTLLFGRYINGNLEKFYTCSACRDRSLCSFYLNYDSSLTKQEKLTWDLERKRFISKYNHKKLFIKFNEVMIENPMNRIYCHTCERLILKAERIKHSDHTLTESLTDYQMTHPTELLKPLGNVKKEAQYFFSEKSTKDIVDMIIKQGMKNVLCIGAPRIHEYINQNYESKISSLLLDFDSRFHNFFGPLQYCWYNLFNHHFFFNEAKNVFKDFVTQNGGKDLILICDPPFGGRVEAMSQTIKAIQDLHKKWNHIEDTDTLKIIFIFPYFMESIIQQKSNPPLINGGLRELKMADYKVDYDNHPLFITGSSGRKYGSPVRIFTNILLRLFKLPESDGYKYCKRCLKWVSNENRHCKKCKECTSKDGRRYKHCNICKRCVKPTWKHCDTCNRCVLEQHECGQGPKITGLCFKCNQKGHIEKNCTVRVDNTAEENIEVDISETKNEEASKKSKNKQKPVRESKEAVSITQAKTMKLKDNSKKRKSEDLINGASKILKKPKSIKSKGSMKTDISVKNNINERKVKISKLKIQENTKKGKRGAINAYSKQNKEKLIKKLESKKLKIRLKVPKK